MYDNDWSSTHSYQFWNKNFTSDPGITNTTTLKTIYSPSPSGFVEPKTAAFTGFTSTGGNTYNGSQFNVSGSYINGWNFYTSGWKTGITLYFNTLGIRDVNTNRNGTGAILGIWGEGYFWTSGGTSISGYLLGVSQNYVQPQSAIGRAYGFSVRSVKE